MPGIALLFAASAARIGSCPPMPPRDMVARTARFGGVIAPSTTDAEEAVVAGTIARHASKRYLGIDPKPFLIAPISQPGGGCAFVFPWSYPSAGPNTTRLPAHVLPHEIGHAVFIRFLVPKTHDDEYGGDAPDWLDEMAALAFEDAAGVRLRRADARRHAERGALLPLARFLSMPHPEWSASVSATGPVTHQPRSTETPAFYATARAMLDFLIERTGNPRVIRALAEQVRAGAPLDRWLVEHCIRSGAVRGLAELDTELARFVLTDPAYTAARDRTAEGDAT